MYAETVISVPKDSILLQPVPNGIVSFYNEPYPVTDEQVKDYRKNGYLKLTKVIEGDALRYSKEIFDEAVKVRTEQDKRTLSEKSLYEQSFLQCGYLCWDFPAIKEFVFGKRFAGIARDLMGVSGVRLWHDQALYKQPGGRITDMHQDTAYWPLKTEQTITLWVALCDVPVERGCLGFIPGSHKYGVKEYVDIFENPHTPEIVKGTKLVSVPLHAGDATYHCGLTFHAANANKTSQTREATTVIYFEDGAPYDDSDERNRTHKSAVGTVPGRPVMTQYTPRLI